LSSIFFLCFSIIEIQSLLYLFFISFKNNSFASSSESFDISDNFQSSSCSFCFKFSFISFISSSFCINFSCFSSICSNFFSIFSSLSKILSSIFSDFLIISLASALASLRISQAFSSACLILFSACFQALVLLILSKINNAIIIMAIHKTIKSIEC
jgi:hypothetical protein